MFSTQPEPISAITGAVVLAYGERSIEDCKLTVPFLQRQYGYDAPVVLVNTSIAGVEGYYLSLELYQTGNIEEVEGVLWVVEDVLDNTPLEEFCTQSIEIDIEELGTVNLYEAYYSHSNVTLRMFIIQ